MYISDLEDGQPLVIFSSRIVIFIGDSCYEVAPFNDRIEPVIDRAYIFGSRVFIYTQEKDINKLEEGFFTIDSDGQPMIREFHDLESKKSKNHSITNITELDIAKMYRDIVNNSDEFTSVEDIHNIINNAEKFVPVINPDDDFLKRIIKDAIIRKKINLKNYRSRAESQHALNNMKSSLIGTTKMSVTNFCKWCEILGLDWKLSISDDGTDKYSPLQDDITIDSAEFIETPEEN